MGAEAMDLRRHLHRSSTTPTGPASGPKSIPPPNVASINCVRGYTGNLTAAFSHRGMDLSEKKTTGMTFVARKGHEGTSLACRRKDPI